MLARWWKNKIRGDDEGQTSGIWSWHSSSQVERASYASYAFTAGQTVLSTVLCIILFWVLRLHMVHKPGKFSSKW